MATTTSVDGIIASSFVIPVNKLRAHIRANPTGSAVTRYQGTTYRLVWRDSEVMNQREGM